MVEKWHDVAFFVCFLTVSLCRKRSQMTAVYAVLVTAILLVCSSSIVSTASNNLESVLTLVNAFRINPSGFLHLMQTNFPETKWNMACEIPLQPLKPVIWSEKWTQLAKLHVPPMGCAAAETVETNCSADPVKGCFNVFRIFNSSTDEIMIDLISKKEYCSILVNPSYNSMGGSYSTDQCSVFIMGTSEIISGEPIVTRVVLRNHLLLAVPINADGRNLSISALSIDGNQIEELFNHGGIFHATNSEFSLSNDFVLQIADSTEGEVPAKDPTTSEEPLVRQKRAVIGVGCTDRIFYDRVITICGFNLQAYFSWFTAGFTHTNPNFLEITCTNVSDQKCLTPRLPINTIIVYQESPFIRMVSAFKTEIRGSFRVATLSLTTTLSQASQFSARFKFAPSIPAPQGTVSGTSNWQVFGATADVAVTVSGSSANLIILDNDVQYKHHSCPANNLITIGFYQSPWYNKEVLPFVVAGVYGYVDRLKIGTNILLPAACGGRLVTVTSIADTALYAVDRIGFTFASVMDPPRGITYQGRLLSSISVPPLPTRVSGVRTWEIDGLQVEITVEGGPFFLIVLGNDVQYQGHGGCPTIPNVIDVSFYRSPLSGRQKVPYDITGVDEDNPRLKPEIYLLLPSLCGGHLVKVSSVQGTDLYAVSRVRFVVISKKDPPAGISYKGRLVSPISIPAPPTRISGVRTWEIDGLQVEVTVEGGPFLLVALGSDVHFEGFEGCPTPAQPNLIKVAFIPSPWNKKKKLSFEITGVDGDITRLKFDTYLLLPPVCGGDLVKVVELSGTDLYAVFRVRFAPVSKKDAPPGISYKGRYVAPIKIDPLPQRTSGTRTLNIYDQPISMALSGPSGRLIVLGSDVHYESDGPCQARPNPMNIAFFPSPWRGKPRLPFDVTGVYGFVDRLARDVYLLLPQPCGGNLVQVVNIEPTGVYAVDKVWFKFISPQDPPPPDFTYQASFANNFKIDPLPPVVSASPTWEINDFKVDVTVSGQAAGLIILGNDVNDVHYQVEAFPNQAQPNLIRIAFHPSPWRGRKILPYPVAGVDGGIRRLQRGSYILLPQISGGDLVEVIETKPTELYAIDEVRFKVASKDPPRSISISGAKLKSPPIIPNPPETVTGDRVWNVYKRDILVTITGPSARLIVLGLPPFRDAQYEFLDDECPKTSVITVGLYKGAWYRQPTLPYPVVGASSFVSRLNPNVFLLLPGKCKGQFLLSVKNVEPTDRYNVFRVSFDIASSPPRDITFSARFVQNVVIPVPPPVIFGPRFWDFPTNRLLVNISGFSGTLIDLTDDVQYRLADDCPAAGGGVVKIGLFESPWYKLRKLPYTVAGVTGGVNRLRKDILILLPIRCGGDLMKVDRVDESAEEYGVFLVILIKLLNPPLELRFSWNAPTPMQLNVPGRLLYGVEFLAVNISSSTANLIDLANDYQFDLVSCPNPFPPLAGLRSLTVEIRCKICPWNGQAYSDTFPYLIGGLGNGRADLLSRSYFILPQSCGGRYLFKISSATLIVGKFAHMQVVGIVDINLPSTISISTKYELPKLPIPAEVKRVWPPLNITITERGIPGQLIVLDEDPFYNLTGACPSPTPATVETTITVGCTACLWYNEIKLNFPIKGLEDGRTRLSTGFIVMPVRCGGQLFKVTQVEEATRISVFNVRVSTAFQLIRNIVVSTNDAIATINPPSPVRRSWTRGNSALPVNITGGPYRLIGLGPNEDPQFELVGGQCLQSIQVRCRTCPFSNQPKFPFNIVGLRGWSGIGRLKPGVYIVLPPSIPSCAGRLVKVVSVTESELRYSMFTVEITDKVTAPLPIMITANAPLNLVQPLSSVTRVWASGSYRLTVRISAPARESFISLAAGESSYSLVDNKCPSLVGGTVQAQIGCTDCPWYRQAKMPFDILNFPDGSGRLMAERFLIAPNICDGKIFSIQSLAGGDQYAVYSATITEAASSLPLLVEAINGMPSRPAPSGPITVTRIFAKDFGQMVVTGDANLIIDGGRGVDPQLSIDCPSPSSGTIAVRCTACVWFQRSPLPFPVGNLYDGSSRLTAPTTLIVLDSQCDGGEIVKITSVKPDKQLFGVYQVRYNAIPNTAPLGSKVFFECTENAYAVYVGPHTMKCVRLPTLAKGTTISFSSVISSSQTDCPDGTAIRKITWNSNGNGATELVCLQIDITKPVAGKILFSRQKTTLNSIGAGRNCAAGEGVCGLAGSDRFICCTQSISIALEEGGGGFIPIILVIPIFSGTGVPGGNPGGNPGDEPDTGDNKDDINACNAIETNYGLDLQIRNYPRSFQVRIGKNQGIVKMISLPFDGQYAFSGDSGIIFRRLRQYLEQCVDSIDPPCSIKSEATDPYVIMAGFPGQHSATAVFKCAVEKFDGEASENIPIFRVSASRNYPYGNNLRLQVDFSGSSLALIDLANDTQLSLTQTCQVGSGAAVAPPVGTRIILGCVKCAGYDKAPPSNADSIPDGSSRLTVGTVVLLPPSCYGGHPAKIQSITKSKTKFAVFTVQISGDFRGKPLPGVNVSTSMKPSSQPPTGQISISQSSSSSILNGFATLSITGNATRLIDLESDSQIRLIGTACPPNAQAVQTVSIGCTVCPWFNQRPLNFPVEGLYGAADRLKAGFMLVFPAQCFLRRIARIAEVKRSGTLFAVFNLVLDNDLAAAGSKIFFSLDYSNIPSFLNTSRYRLTGFTPFRPSDVANLPEDPSKWQAFNFNSWLNDAKLSSLTSTPLHLSQPCSFSSAAIPACLNSATSLTITSNSSVRFDYAFKIYGELSSLGTSKIFSYTRYRPSIISSFRLNGCYQKRAIDIVLQCPPSGSGSLTAKLFGLLTIEFSFPGIKPQLSTNLKGRSLVSYQADVSWTDIFAVGITQPALQSSTNGITRNVMNPQLSFEPAAQGVARSFDGTIVNSFVSSLTWSVTFPRSAPFTTKIQNTAQLSLVSTTTPGGSNSLGLSSKLSSSILPNLAMISSNDSQIISYEFNLASFSAACQQLEVRYASVSNIKSYPTTVIVPITGGQATLNFIMHNNRYFSFRTDSAAAFQNMQKTILTCNSTTNPFCPSIFTPDLSKKSIDVIGFPGQYSATALFKCVADSLKISQRGDIGSLVVSITCAFGLIGVFETESGGPEYDCINYFDQDFQFLSEMDCDIFGSTFGLDREGQLYYCSSPWDCTSLTVVSSKIIASQSRTGNSLFRLNGPFLQTKTGGNCVYAAKLYNQLVLKPCPAAGQPAGDSIVRIDYTDNAERYLTGTSVCDIQPTQCSSNPDRYCEEYDDCMQEMQDSKLCLEMLDCEGPLVCDGEDVKSQCQQQEKRLAFDESLRAVPSEVVIRSVSGAQLGTLRLVSTGKGIYSLQAQLVPLYELLYTKMIACNSSVNPSCPASFVNSSSTLSVRLNTAGGNFTALALFKCTVDSIDSAAISDSCKPSDIVDLSAWSRSWAQFKSWANDKILPRATETAVTIINPVDQVSFNIQFATANVFSVFLSKPQPIYLEMASNCLTRINCSLSNSLSAVEKSCTSLQTLTLKSSLQAPYQTFICRRPDIMIGFPYGQTACVSLETFGGKAAYTSVPNGGGTILIDKDTSLISSGSCPDSSFMESFNMDLVDGRGSATFSCSQLSIIIAGQKSIATVSRIATSARIYDCATLGPMWFMTGFNVEFGELIIVTRPICAMAEFPIDLLLLRSVYPFLPVPVSINEVIGSSVSCNILLSVGYEPPPSYNPISSCASLGSVFGDSSKFARSLTLWQSDSFIDLIAWTGSVQCPDGHTIRSFTCAGVTPASPCSRWKIVCAPLNLEHMGESFETSTEFLVGTIRLEYGFNWDTNVITRPFVFSCESLGSGWILTGIALDTGVLKCALPQIVIPFEKSSQLSCNQANFDRVYIDNTAGINQTGLVSQMSFCIANQAEIIENAKKFYDPKCPQWDGKLDSGEAWSETQFCVDGFCLRPAYDSGSLSIRLGVDFTTVTLDQTAEGMSEESNPQVDCHYGPAVAPLAVFLDYQETRDCGGDFCGYDDFKIWGFDVMYCMILNSMTNQPAYTRGNAVATHAAYLNEFDFTCPDHTSIAKIVCESWRDVQRCVGQGDNGGLLGMGGCDYAYFRTCERVRVECSAFTHARTGGKMLLESKGQWEDVPNVVDWSYPFVIGWKVGFNVEKPLVLRARVKNVDIGSVETADKIKRVISSVRDECIPWVNCKFASGDKQVLGNLVEDLANGMVRVSVLNGADAALLQQKLVYCMSKRFTTNYGEGGNVDVIKPTPNVRRQLQEATEDEVMGNVCTLTSTGPGLLASTWQNIVNVWRTIHPKSPAANLRQPFEEGQNQCSCNEHSAAFSVECLANKCAVLSLTCSPIKDEVGVVSAATQQERVYTEWASEQQPSGVFCATGTAVTQLLCKDTDCSQFRLGCSSFVSQNSGLNIPVQFNETEGQGCGWSHFFSGNTLVGAAGNCNGFIRGMRARGPGSAEMSVYCCHAYIDESAEKFCPAQSALISRSSVPVVGSVRDTIARYGNSIVTAQACNPTLNLDAYAQFITVLVPKQPIVKCSNAAKQPLKALASDTILSIAAKSGATSQQIIDCNPQIPHGSAETGLDANQLIRVPLVVTTPPLAVISDSMEAFILVRVYSQAPQSYQQCLIYNSTQNSFTFRQSSLFDRAVLDSDCNLNKFILTAEGRLSWFPGSGQAGFPVGITTAGTLGRTNDYSSHFSLNDYGFLMLTASRMCVNGVVEQGGKISPRLRACNSAATRLVFPLRTVTFLPGCF